MVLTKVVDVLKAAAPKFAQHFRFDRRAGGGRRNLQQQQVAAAANVAAMGTGSSNFSFGILFFTSSRFGLLRWVVLA